MTVTVRCPNPDCGKAYSVPEDQLGHAAVCKRCGRKFTLKASGRETLRPDAQADTAGSPPDKPAEPTPEGTPRKLGRFEIR